MKRSSIEWLHSEYKRILGDVMVTPTQGIENNNGWIKVESEADLPSEKIKVWFFTFGEEKIGTFHPLLKEFRTESNIYNYGSVTHYQPIQKPKPPIY